MTQIVQEQQWQTWNRTHWSINIHSVVNLQIMSLRFLFTAVLFVACVRCFARSWQDKFVSVQSEDSQFSPQFGVAAEHGCESRRVTADLIWLFASNAAEALIVLCVCQELYVCVRGERERAQKALCPWLRQRADSESSFTVMSCVFSLSPSTEWKACLWYQQLGQKDRSRWRKPCSGGERERWKV